jgi:hypothetical protein
MTAGFLPEAARTSETLDANSSSERPKTAAVVAQYFMKSLRDMFPNNVFISKLLSQDCFSPV